MQIFVFGIKQFTQPHHQNRFGFPLAHSLHASEIISDGMRFEWNSNVNLIEIRIQNGTQHQTQALGKYLHQHRWRILHQIYTIHTIYLGFNWNRYALYILNGPQKASSLIIFTEYRLTGSLINLYALHVVSTRLVANFVLCREHILR